MMQYLSVWMCMCFSESPRKYVESEVSIHYRSPVRIEAKEMLSEEELARRQAEAMRRIYQEERRRKYLQVHTIESSESNFAQRSIKISNQKSRK